MYKSKINIIDLTRFCKWDATTPYAAKFRIEEEKVAKIVDNNIYQITS